MATTNKRLFIGDDGKNLVVTFTLVSSLFLLWGFCNGMIDVMDKHFQDELHLTLSQSAWVQFAHYLGYFLMSLPAGWLATKLGYKGGIIAGLLMVAVGGLWFIPATKIAAFWAFLLGVCVIASGLTFLETVANPYTTVLGPPEFAATRINLAQSCNGIGWILGPIAGSMFFYSTDATGKSTGAVTLWIPYAGVAVVVVLLAAIFFKAEVPDIKTEDDYHLDDSTPGVSHSIWKHPHFSMAVVAQFFYVAAQAGIFSFLINYMTSEIPSLPESLRSGYTQKFVATKTAITAGDIQDLPGLATKLQERTDPVSAFIAADLGASTSNSLAAYRPASGDSKALRIILAQDLNGVVKKAALYTPERFAGVTLSEKTKAVLAEDASTRNTAYFNRLLLQDAYSKQLTFKDGILSFSDKGASLLASAGFVCFLIGRFTGAGLLKKYSAHKMLGLYGVMNVLMCLLVFFKLGWFSVVCVFLSYFFMSIMFPTIFALGIFGLGVRAKRASAYIVMAIMGGALLPKVMGAVADNYDMSRGFIVPMVCFAIIAFYGYNWPKLSKNEGVKGLSTAGGH